jgi:hypothetical protein
MPVLKMLIPLDYQKHMTRQLTDDELLILIKLWREVYPYSAIEQDAMVLARAIARAQYDVSNGKAI